MAKKQKEQTIFEMELTPLLQAIREAERELIDQLNDAADSLDRARKSYIRFSHGIIALPKALSKAGVSREIVEQMF